MILSGNLVIFVQSGSNKQVAQAPPSPDAASRRIIHVGFIVRDAAKEDTFWRDVLGFRPNWHGGMTDTTTDWSSVQVPDGTDWLEYMLNIPAYADSEAGWRAGPLLSGCSPHVGCHSRAPEKQVRRTQLYRMPRSGETAKCSSISSIRT